MSVPFKNGVKVYNSLEIPYQGGHGRLNVSDDNYIRVNAQILSAKWDGHNFDDYLDQPVRKTDSPRFHYPKVGAISQPNFASGFSGYGWRIDEDGSATFENLTVRKEMKVYELTVEKIRGGNGSYWFSDGTEDVINVEENAGLYTVTLDTDQGRKPMMFRDNDIVRCQNWTGKDIKYYSALVSNVTDTTFQLQILEGGGVPAVGDAIVRIGNTTDKDRQGAIYITSNDDNAPYIDVLDGIDSPSFRDKIKVRLGRLDGITDEQFGVLQGYGMFSQNVYLKGKFWVTGGNAATQDYTDGKVNALRNSLGGLAYEDAVEAAKLGSTIIQGGYIKNDLLDAAAIVVRGGGATVTQLSVSQAAAIQQASTDATSKANSAQQQAESYSRQLVNSVSVGAINILTSSNFNTSPLAWSNTSIQVQTGTTPNYLIVQKGTASYGFILVIEGDIIANHEYTLSFDWGGANTDVLDYIHILGSPTNLKTANLTGLPVNAGTGWTWTRQSLTFSVPETRTSPRILIATNTGTFFRIKAVKLEKGNKATDWSPSIADTNTAISNAQTAATAAQTAYNNLTSQLKGMAYKDVVQLADLGTTVISGGKIVTTLLDAAYIRSNIVNAGYINTLSLDASAIKSGTIDASRINASQIISNGGGATTAALNNAINSVQLGAINLLNGSSFDTTPLRWSDSDNIIQTTTTPNYLIVRKGTGGTYGFHLPINEPVMAGQQYTLSFDMGGNDITTLSYVYIISTQGNVVLPAIPIPRSDGWIRYTHTFSIGVDRSEGLYILIATSSGTAFRIKAVKLEKGNKATDWSPSVADTNTSISTAQTAANLANSRIGNTTIISGGKIVTSLIDTAALQASIVTAAYINTLALNASAIKAGTIDTARLNVAQIFAQSVSATNLTVTGNSRLANWSVSGGGLESVDGSGYLYSSRDINNGKIEVKVGSNYINGVNPSTSIGSETSAAIFTNTRVFANGHNIGIKIDVSGSGIYNDAIRIQNGDIRLMNQGKLILAGGGIMAGGLDGKTMWVSIKGDVVGALTYWHNSRYVNGILVDYVYDTNRRAS